MKYKPRATPDLSGQRFGLLTVIGRRPERGIGSRDYHWDCRCDCGELTTARTGVLKAGRKKSCGCYLRKKGLAWRAVTPQGYILIRRPEHPNARSNGSIFEHTFVMSEHLGRPLLSTENVHHINGQRDDNRLQNLELWSTSQPAGQRVEDKIAWARSFLAEYDHLNTGAAKAAND